jgi:hypothetical protein
MSCRTCDHLKEDGIYCDSPALRGQNFCYYHLNVRGRRLQMARARRRGEACRLQLPVLDDMHAVQASLMQVLDAPHPSPAVSPNPLGSAGVGVSTEKVA